MRSFVLMLLVLSFSCPVFAEDHAPAAAAPVKVGNKVCPVSGEKIGDMGGAVPYEYQGKIYHLCCPMCSKEFDADPEKYSKIAEDEIAESQKNGS